MRTTISHRRTAAIALSLVALVALATLAPGVDAKRQQRRANTARVEIDDFAFKPKALRIPRGTEVVFVNRDSAPHTATKRGSFDTGRLRKGQAASVRFKRRGTFRYACTIHPFMHGKIVVR
jgi:plastocyanin